MKKLKKCMTVLFISTLILSCSDNTEDLTIDNKIISKKSNNQPSFLDISDLKTIEYSDETAILTSFDESTREVKILKTDNAIRIIDKNRELKITKLGEELSIEAIQDGVNLNLQPLDNTFADLAQVIRHSDSSSMVQIKSHPDDGVAMSFSTRKSNAQAGVEAQVKAYLADHPNCKATSGVDCGCIWGDTICVCSQTIDCK